MQRHGQENKGAASAADRSVHPLKMPPIVWLHPQASEAVQQMRTCAKLTKMSCQQKRRGEKDISFCLKWKEERGRREIKV